MKDRKTPPQARDEKTPFFKNGLSLIPVKNKTALEKESPLPESPEPQPDIVFMAQPLVQVTLPHKNPGDDQLIWMRRNGDLILSIRSGWDTTAHKTLGFPYGTIPRLLLFWITTEAVKTQKREIELGRSLSDFMRKLNLNPKSGTGPRSDYYRLRIQMEKLFRATISFEYKSSDKTRNLNTHSWVDMQIAPAGEFWWNSKLPDEKIIFNSSIELGEKFFSAVVNNPVPLDLEAITSLRNSPLALDLYAWTTYKTYYLNKNKFKKSFFISWSDLSMQLGGEYERLSDFKRKTIQALEKVQKVYKCILIDDTDDGLILSNGFTSILPKKY